MRLVAALIAAQSGFLFAPPARAWWVDDPIHHSCHERITAAALKEVGYAVPPPALSKQDARLRNSVQFDAYSYDANIYALSLIIGARWPDAQGAADFDFYQLAEVHNAAGDQGAHCLRAETQDGGQAADRAALLDCRMHIERAYWQALKSLDQTGNVDPGARELVSEFIPFVGKSDVPISGFYSNAGVAMHAIQDSFTHTYRTSGYAKILSVFNWSDQVRGTLTEARDGHGHETVLDDCEDATAGNDVPTRMAATVKASAQFLRALTEPGDRATRQARLDQFFADWMTYAPGCDLVNEYCMHPLQKFLRDSGKSDVYGKSGCSAAPGRGNTQSSGASIMAMLVAGVFRRTRRRAGKVAMALAVAAGLLGPPVAQAQAVGPRGYRSEVRASLSVQNPAYAAGFSGAYAWRRFEAGGFVEINPWYSVEKRYTFLGATNAGAFFHYLHPLGPDVRLRSGLGLGVSMLNQDWYGTDAGHLGVYLNIRLLGVVLPLSGGTSFTIDAFDLALPSPQLTGWPITYAQHRLSIGLQF